MVKHIQLAVVAVGGMTVTAGQAVMTVPSSLHVFVSRSPVEFTMALANTSVPSGLEIRESDNVMPSSPPAVSVDPKERVALSDLVESFNAQHSDYTAVVMRGGVTVVRPTSGRLAFLDQPSSISQVVTVTGAMAAARRVFAALDPGLAGPVLNSAGHRGDDVPLVLDGRDGQTVTDTLNQIVTQAPGRAWVVTTRQEQNTVRVVGFGFLEADGSRRYQPMRP